MENFIKIPGNVDQALLDALNKISAARQLRVLDLCLMGAPDYRLNGAKNPNSPQMNDYKTLVEGLNYYGKVNPEFADELTMVLNQCLDKNTPGAASHITAIIYRQLIYQSDNKEYIRFISTDLCEKLGKVIVSNKASLQAYRLYEGALYEDGMYGHLIRLCAQIKAGWGLTIL